MDRHIEQSELTDASLNKRAFKKPLPMEDTVINNMQTELLHKFIAELPETQRRRLSFYYFARMTYVQIAELEGCKYPAVIKSVNAALEKLKKLFLK